MVAGVDLVYETVGKKYGRGGGAQLEGRVDAICPLHNLQLGSVSLVPPTVRKSRFGVLG